MMVQLRAVLLIRVELHLVVLDIITAVEDMVRVPVAAVVVVHHGVSHCLPVMHNAVLLLMVLSMVVVCNMGDCGVTRLTRILYQQAVRLVAAVLLDWVIPETWVRILL